MSIQIKKTILICLASTLLAMLFNFCNTHLLQSDGIALRDNQMVITADDISYLAPADNFIQNGVWKSNTIGNNAYYLRTPGYGGIYLIFKLLFPTNALLALKLFQILLFGISTGLLYLIAQWFCKNNIAATIASIVYGCTPFACGFLSYTLTEAVTPALVIINLFCLLRYADKEHIGWLIAHSVFLAILIITRPVLGFWLGLSVVVIGTTHTTIANKIRHLLMVLFIAMLPTILWQIRGYQIANKVIGLHPIYSTDSPDVFRPSHLAVWQFTKKWNSNGEQFHNTIQQFWVAAEKGDTLPQCIEQTINKIPPKVVQTIGINNIHTAYTSYYQLLQKQMFFVHTNSLVSPQFCTQEQAVVQIFDSLSKVMSYKLPLQTHIITPLKSYCAMALHSNLSMYMFQKSFRGKKAMESMRLLFFAIHAFLFIIVWVALVIYRTDIVRLTIICLVCIYLIFLAWIQRGVEERYTLPVLPLLIVIATGTIVKTYRFLQTRKEKSAKD